MNDSNHIKSFKPKLCKKISFTIKFVLFYKKNCYSYTCSGIKRLIKILPLVADSGGADSGVFTLSVEPACVAVGGDSRRATCFISLRGLVPRDLQNVTINQLLSFNTFMDGFRLPFSKIILQWHCDQTYSKSSF